MGSIFEKSHEFLKQCFIIKIIYFAFSYKRIQKYKGVSTISWQMCNVEGMR